MNKNKFKECFEYCFMQAILSFDNNRIHDKELFDKLKPNEIFVLGELTNDIVDILTPAMAQLTKLAEEYSQKMGVKQK